MGTIAEKLAYLNNTKTAIKNAIIDKGVAVSDSDTFRSYADRIGQITSGGREYYCDFEFDDNTDSCSDKTISTSYGTISNGQFTTNTSNVTSVGGFYSDCMKTQNFCIEIKFKINSYNGSLVDIFETYSGSNTHFWFNIYKNGNYEIGGFMGSSSNVADTSGASGCNFDNTWNTVKVRFVQKPTRQYEIYFNDVLVKTKTNSYSFQNFTTFYLNGGQTNTSYKGSVTYEYIRMYWES